MNEKEIERGKVYLCTIDGTLVQCVVRWPQGGGYWFVHRWRPTTQKFTGYVIEARLVEYRAMPKNEAVILKRFATWKKANDAA